MLSFHRQISVGLKLKEPLSNGRQGLFFILSAGFSAPVEPLTGMSVSLPLIDEWLAEEKNRLETGAFSMHSKENPEVALEVFFEVQKELSEKAAKHSVDLRKLIADFHEYQLSWERDLGFTQTERVQVEVLDVLGVYGHLEVRATVAAPSNVHLHIASSFSSLSELLRALSDQKPSFLQIDVYDHGRAEKWVL